MVSKPGSLIRLLPSSAVRAQAVALEEGGDEELGELEEVEVEKIVADAVAVTLEVWRNAIVDLDSMVTVVVF